MSRHVDKNALRKRLTEEGRWDAFVQRREALKRAGVPVADAWVQAAREFPPDGETGAAESDAAPRIEPSPAAKPVSGTIPGVPPVEAFIALLEKVGSRPCSPRAAVLWVAGNLSADPSKIDPETVPGTMAIEIWRDTVYTLGRAEFWRTLFQRVAGKDDGDGGGADPGTERVVSLIDDLERVAAEAREGAAA